jgi:hypothetical protein
MRAQVLLPFTSRHLRDKYEKYGGTREAEETADELSTI